MNTMLGGEVAQLQDHATAYRALGDNLVASGGNVVTTTDGAVAALWDALSAARAAVVSSLQSVSQESRSVMAGFGDVQWTGADRIRAGQVGMELDSRVTETTVRVQEIFEAFQADLTRVGGELTEAAGRFNAVAAAAGGSAASLGRAMEARAVRLDSAVTAGIGRA